MTISIVSYGGGVNSTAMLIGLAERKLRPDAILFADTGGEHDETYAFINRFESWLAKNDMPQITRVRATHHKSLEDECRVNATLPSKAFGFGGCSVKWKRQPMDKWVKQWDKAQAAWERGEKIQRLIGIHAGETKRGKIPDDKRFTYLYPLRAWQWYQHDCLEAIVRAGLPKPMKSACFFCPAKKKVEVLQLAQERPDLLERCIKMERNAKDNLETVKGLGRNWSWEDLSKAEEAQLKMFPDLQAPLCSTCMDD